MGLIDKLDLMMSKRSGAAYQAGHEDQLEMERREKEQMD